CCVAASSSFLRVATVGLRSMQTGSPGLRTLFVAHQSGGLVLRIEVTRTHGYRGLGVDVEDWARLWPEVGVEVPSGSSLHRCVELRVHVGRVGEVLSLLETMHGDEVFAIA